MVVIIIGVLTAFGVPRLWKSVERSKAAEAFNYCAQVRAPKERYQAREGTFLLDGFGPKGWSQLALLKRPKEIVKKAFQIRFDGQ